LLRLGVIVKHRVATDDELTQRLLAADVHEHLIVVKLHSRVFSVLRDQDILLRVGSRSALLLWWLSIQHVYLFSLKLLWGFVLVQDLDQLLLDDAVRLGEGVPGDPSAVVAVAGLLPFRLLLPLPSLPKGLFMEVIFVTLLTHIEIVYLHFELFSSELILNEV
jgi:hypothetical protein